VVNFKQIIRQRVDPRLRDALWAYRTRRDVSVAVVAIHSALNWHYPVGSDLQHLGAVIGWLCAAQDATPDNGVAAFYDIRVGAWGPSYPETTGYIIPTLFDYAAYTQKEMYRDRAVRMADWLLTLQMENGAFPIGPLWQDWERRPIVFDTGQIIQGLARAYQETENGIYLEAASRAGDWLVALQDGDGCWRKFTSQGVVHTYNVRVAWALLQLSFINGDEQHQNAAVRNLEWALTQQEQDGWFRNAAFRLDEDPLTHTIAYTIEGLLESGVLLNDQRFIESARLAADVLRLRQEQDGYLRARYGQGWKSDTDWSCLTGSAQMALVWLRLFQLTGDLNYLSAARVANDYLKRRHPRHGKLPGVVGGLAGSYPIYEAYEPYRNLNWAAKFFADSLLLSIQLASSQA